MEECQCLNKALTLRKVSNGTSHYCYQCIICGKSSPFLKRLDAEKIIASGVPVEPYDEYRQDRYYDDTRASSIAEREADTQKRRDEYSGYLQSPEWKSIREKVLNRCVWTCEGCGECRATHVHHKTYDNIFDELMFQLVGLCDSCHKKLHPGAADE